MTPLLTHLLGLLWTLHQLPILRSLYYCFCSWPIFTGSSLQSPVQTWHLCSNGPFSRNHNHLAQASCGTVSHCHHIHVHLSFYISNTCDVIQYFPLWLIRRRRASEGKKSATVLFKIAPKLFDLCLHTVYIH